ncbi:hypothetical protein ACE1CI_00240 [Aerosakkonemataceae cyanobacterium BLCC-F50]|uniref:Uncharacterized protein n=1 Tax=Floridaenema flaviceps BLCC-F50 TaxID=3153642 RepID=A0ABV4XI21_9CYAN
MSYLTDIIQEFKQQPLNQNQFNACALAEKALAVTLDKKLIKAGLLNTLATQLNEIIEILHTSFPDVPIDDLRYRLAHLYMRNRQWEKADEQLLNIHEDFFNATEAKIYSTLCSIKQGDSPFIEKLANQITESRNQSSKTIQEYHYNLLEMLVYASGIDHSVLQPYYCKGTTKADLEVRYYHEQLSQSNPSLTNLRWQPMARFRIRHLLENSQGFLILNMSNRPIEEIKNFVTPLREPIKKLAEILCSKFPFSTFLDDLINEFIEEGYMKSKRPGTISDWKTELCSSLHNPEAVVQSKNEGYKICYPFILIRKRI